MCRALMYLGKPILIDDLLYRTDSSLVKQAYQPRYMVEFNNLAGFGLIAWNEHSEFSEKPFTYRTTTLPFFDRNLKALVTKTRANCLIAHVRGAPYSEKSVIDSRNIHPFKFDDVGIALAHNGDLFEFKKMRYDLIDHMKPEFADNIEGTTDSECVYALLMSQLAVSPNQADMKAIVDALYKTIHIIRKVRAKKSINQASPLNLFITNSKCLIATRFVFDFGHFTRKHNRDDLSYQSLWFTVGKEYGFENGEFKMLFGDKPSSVIVASEPLTSDTTTWLEVPEYSIFTASIENDEVKIQVEDIP
jgi:glutamine amidotransferase